MNWKELLLSLTRELPYYQRITVTVGGGGMDVGLNADKILRAKTIYDEKYPGDENNPFSQRVMFLGSYQLNRDLGEYRLEREVAQKGFHEFVGFKIVLVDFLKINESGDREVIVMRLDAIGPCLFIPMDIDSANKEDVLIIECDES